MPVGMGKCKALAMAIQHIFELFLSTRLEFQLLFSIVGRFRSVCSSSPETINKKYHFSNKSTKKSTENFLTEKLFYHSHAQKSPIFVSFHFISTGLLLHHRHCLSRAAIPSRADTFFSHSAANHVLGALGETTRHSRARKRAEFFESTSTTIRMVNNYFQLFD